MKGKTKLKLVTLIIMLAMVVCIPVGNVKASLQANPNTHYKKVNIIGNWMVNIRNMEKEGQAMGLSEELNTDYTSKSSNGIDVHMMKSTEYGAIAILSASGYGNAKKLQDSTEKTTTGNKTGVYFSGANWEFVAGGGAGNPVANMNSRYYNQYGSTVATAKLGDALGNKKVTNKGCQGWHGASNSGWAHSYCFWRGGGGLFSFSSYVYDDGEVYYGRGVAVCGNGF